MMPAPEKHRARETDMGTPGPFSPVSGGADQSRLSALLSRVLWPLLAGACCAGTAWGLRAGLSGGIVVAMVFLGLSATLTFL
jgi:hypothetical protein